MPGPQHQTPLQHRGPLSQDLLDAKVRQYEAFANDILKGDLQKSTELRSRYEVELQQYEQLLEDIRLLQQEHLSELQTTVDIGAEVTCRVHVPDTSRLYVSIGLGFHVECKLDEVSQVTAPRRAALRANVEACSATNAKLRAQIRLVEEGIRELSGLSSSGTPQVAASHVRGGFGRM